jgi:hypothetical protein
MARSSDLVRRAGTVVLLADLVLRIRRILTAVWLRKPTSTNWSIRFNERNSLVSNVHLQDVLECI